MAGLTIARADFQSVQTIQAGGQTIHGDAGQTTTGGTAVVYVDAGGPHAKDLFIVHRQGNDWTNPMVLTSSSPYAYNSWPVLSPDNQKVIFDAGNEPYGGPGTHICAVNLDSTGFQELISPANPPPGFLTSPVVACHSPAFAPDGSVVFEGQWGNDPTNIGVERLWRRPAGGGNPFLINGSLTNDNSPNVLPDGRIVSLWLGSPGGMDLHEIKVMDSTGQHYVMLTSSASPFPEVDDIGLGCGPSFNPTAVLNTTEPPADYSLQQNYPNPFNPSTTIEFSLPYPAHINLSVYNVLGEQIAVLLSKTFPTGTHKVSWNASSFASGVYLYSLHADLFHQTKKLMLIK